jgi:DNA adenine methylase
MDNLDINNKHNKKEEIKKCIKSVIKAQKPFIKWVGGKTQIIHNIIQQIPSEMNNYHELFLGGGSVLLAVLSLKKDNKITIKNKIYAYDINKQLINLYKNIQTNKEELFKHLTTYINEYKTLTGDVINRKPLTLDEAKTSKESYYYWIRKIFNTMDKETIEYSALFIFINKTCFRGVYRVGPNGFNVPYGHYKNTPAFITKIELDNISDLIKDVIFICDDFKNSIKKIQKGDYVYLDPPYAPINKNSFVGYTKDGFDLETHNKLFDGIIELDKKKIKFTMSNAKVNLVTNHFKNFKCEELIAKRAINSKKPGSTTIEVLISN